MQAPHRDAFSSKLEDEWQAVDFNGETVMFRPYQPHEVEACVAEVQALVAPR